MKIKDFKIENCETCELNEAKKKPVSKDSYTRATRTVDIVHIDILGPIHPIAEDGHRRMDRGWTVDIVHIDILGPIHPIAEDGQRMDYPPNSRGWRYLKIYFMKTRDGATEKMESFIANIGVPQTLISDGAGEYIGQDFKQVCRKQKIRLKTSAPYTPQENGKIEKVWGTITPMARCMIFDANLSKTYWHYALNNATNLKKMYLHSAIGKTP